MYLSLRFLLCRVFEEGVIARICESDCKVSRDEARSHLQGWLLAAMQSEKPIDCDKMTSSNDDTSAPLPSAAAQLSDASKERRQMSDDRCASILVGASMSRVVDYTTCHKIHNLS